MSWRKERNRNIITSCIYVASLLEAPYRTVHPPSYAYLGTIPMILHLQNTIGSCRHFPWP